MESKTGIPAWEPNIQNIPISTEISREVRKAFRERTEIVMTADYSKAEIRILDELSKTKKPSGFTLIEFLILLALILSFSAVCLTTCHDVGQCKEWRVVPESMECWTLGSYTSCEPKKECMDP